MKITPESIHRDEATALGILDQEKEIALDLETSGLSPRKDKIAVLSMFGEDTKAAAVLHLHGYMSDHLQRFLSDPRRRFTVHYGVGFDICFLAASGVDYQKPKWFDTLVGETVVQTTGRRDVSASLKATLNRRLGVKIKKEADHGSWMNEVLTDQQMEYVLEDILYLHETRHAHEAKCLGNSQERALEAEMELVPVVAGMTMTGMPIDVAKLHDHVAGQLKKAQDLEPSLTRQLGIEKLNSPIVMKKALEALGIELPNTQKETLKLMAELSEGDRKQLFLDIIGYREGIKAQMYDGDWVDQWVEAGRVYSRWWQCGTDTTRFSSSDPNAQQYTKKMRVVFGRPGYKIVSGDYSQIEVRVAADIARDKVLLDLVQTEDIHTSIASQVFGVPATAVTREQRQLAKAMSFTLLFGGGARTLMIYAKMSGANIDLAYAKHLVATFFDRFKGLAYLRARAYDMVQRGGAKVITLPTGHRRVLVGPTLTPSRLLNTSVQGTAAAGIKFAMIECRRRGLDKYLRLQVHDELVAEVPDALAVEYGKELDEAMIVGMRQAVKTVALKVEIKIGDYWS